MPAHPASSSLQQQLSELTATRWLVDKGCSDITTERRVELGAGTHVVVDAIGYSPDDGTVIVEVTLGANLDFARGDKFLADVAKLKLLRDLGIADLGVLLLGSQRALEQARGRRWSAFAAATWGLTVELAALDKDQMTDLAATQLRQGGPEANTRRESAPSTPW